MLKKIKASADYIFSKTGFWPEVGIILGTGLGGLVEKITVQHVIDYEDIPNFPASTVEGHVGRLILGTLGEHKVIAMQGRFHYYEGYEPWQVSYPVRVMRVLGIKYLFVSNAAGGLNGTFSLGDLMVITDHINLIPNVLIGQNIDEWGARFPEMVEPYDRGLIADATRIAELEGIKLQYGCYVGTPGPSFETPKEYEYYRRIGGDAVGMSTTPEVIAARHMGIPCFGISVITNLAFSRISNDHTDVQIQAATSAANMTRLFTRMLEEL